MMSTINTDSSIYEALGLSRELEESNQNELALEDFLELMVTELTHQDPFKPMENTELATQISQFATVSGIDELNQSFTDLSGSLLSDQALQAANLVGRDVLVPSDIGYYATGSTLDGVVDLEMPASDVTVRVYSSSGSLVRELSLGTQTGGQVAFSWDGLTDSGDYAPSGQYYVTSTAVMDGETVAPYTLLEAKVKSVSVGAGQDLSLNLEGLGTVSFNDVAEIH
jgi:flagellar basal-body rod modification protein FlgD